MTIARCFHTLLVLAVSAVAAHAAEKFVLSMAAEEATFEVIFRDDPVAAGRALTFYNASVCATNPSSVLLQATSWDAISLSTTGGAAKRHALLMALVPLSKTERSRHCAWSAKIIKSAEKQIEDLHAPKDGLGQD